MMKELLFGQKVLVADDDETFRMLMRELLEANLGVEVVEATDGEEAWEKLNAGLAPGLCIVDVRMPKIGGLALLARLRGDRRFAQQKIMLCSTVNSRSTILEAAGLRVDAFLLKPFDAGEFLAHVRAMFPKSTAKAPPILEPTDEVLQRLDVGIKSYLRLLTVLGHEIQAFVQRFSTSSAATYEDLQLRVSALKGATASLGAVGLMELFAGLEKIEPAHVRDALPILKAISEERLRLLAAIADLEQKVANACRAANAEQWRVA
jgi:two-component system chemotaxis response regulator CheY